MRRAFLMTGCLFFAVLVAASMIAAQETLPTPRRLEPVPAPRNNDNGDTDYGIDGKASLPDLIKQHRAEREALESTFDAVNREFSANAGLTVDDTETATLRLRIHEALARISKKRPPGSSTHTKKSAPSLLPPGVAAPEHVDSRPDDSAPIVPVPKDVGSHPLPDGSDRNTDPATAKNIDSTSVAYSLVRAGKYDAALTVYQSIDIKETSFDERSAIQYLAATCMRNVGKLEEATNLYREVANAKADPYIATCAQWQLASMRWQQSMKERLEEIRRRRSVMGAPPAPQGTSP
jgi:hypothetical protein